MSRHRSRPFLARLLTALVLLVLSAATTAAGELRELVILHTNDVHGQLLTQTADLSGRREPIQIGGLPRVAAAARAEREAGEAAGRAVFLVDAGDWWRGTPEGGLGGGADFVAILAAAGYDAMCIGNHELDEGLAHLLKTIDRSGVPAVCANVTTRDGKPLGDVPPWRIVERDGLRVAFVGLVTTMTPTITHRDARELRFEDPVEALRRARAELAEVPGGCDLVVPVTHLGVEEDRRLARAFPDLPLIVGGHSHTLLREGVHEGDTLIVQAGAKASNLGRVLLRLDLESGRVVATEAELRLLAEEPDPEHRVERVETLAARLAQRAGREMDAVVGELEGPLVRSVGWPTGTAGNWVTDVMRAHARADVAIQNRGGLRRDVPAGPVTRRALYELLPFGNDLVVLELSGDELREVLRRGVEGVARSVPEVSGLRLAVRVDGEGRGTLEEVEVGGEPLDLARVYAVATNSYLADGGDGLFDEQRILERRAFGVVLREVLEKALRRDRKVTPAEASRIELVSEHGKR